MRCAAEIRISGIQMKRVSEKKHWDDFWSVSDGAEEIYDNEGRVSRHLMDLWPLEGMKILEVGAGTGRDGIFMASRGASVVSLDYSLPSLEMVRSQIPDGGRVDLCCGDAFSLPFGEETFDVVFHQGLLEHFRNPGDMLAEHHRVLKRGGHILVDVPQRWHYYTLLKHAMIAAGKWFAGWETEFSPRELEKMLRQNSFAIVGTYGEWLNPPIWYRILRRGMMQMGARLPMYPHIFANVRRTFASARARLLSLRPVLYTTVVIGTIARKD
jgi:ubiquinone/menaquinone biosynthesis C-methylase UbiE